MCSVSGKWRCCWRPRFLPVDVLPGAGLYVDLPNADGLCVRALLQRSHMAPGSTSQIMAEHAWLR